MQFFKDLKLRRLFSLLAVFLMLGAAVDAGVAAAATTTSGIVHGGTLTFATIGPAAPGLDVFGPTNTAIQQQYGAVYDPLFFPNNATGGVYPGLALSYSTSNAGKTITLQLRKGVKFSDGTPFNSSAVVFNVRRSASSAQNSECVGDMLWYQSVKALGPYTVQINFIRPDPTYIALISQAQCGYMESPTAVTAEGAQYGIKPVGTGPFMQTSFVPGNTWTFTANPHYWQKGYPLVKNLEFINYGNSSAADACVASGQCDAFIGTGTNSPGAVDMSNYGSNPAIKFYKINNTSQTNVLWLQTQKAPFNNPTARLAVAEAINQRQIISSLYTASNGVKFMTPATGPLPPGSWAYPGANVGYPAYNPTKAAALVSSLGGLSFSLLVPNSSNNTQVAEAVQAQLEAVGMHVTITSEATTAVTAALHPGNFQMINLQFNAPTPPLDPDLVLGDILYSQSPRDSSQLNDPTMDALIIKSENSFSHSYRAAVYKLIAQRWAKDLPQILIGNQALYSMVNVHLFRGVAVPWNSKGTFQQSQYVPYWSYWVA